MSNIKKYPAENLTFQEKLLFRLQEVEDFVGLIKKYPAENLTFQEKLLRLQEVEDFVGLIKKYPAENLTFQEKLLRLQEVEDFVGFKKSKIYELINEKRFPAPIRLGSRSVRWKRSAIQGFIDSLTSSGKMEVAQ